MRGCEEDAGQPVKIMNEVLTRCPKRPLLDHPAWYTELFWYYRKSQDGLLPEPGGLLDQAAALVTAFQVIDHGLSLANGERQKKD